MLNRKDVTTIKLAVKVEAVVATSEDLMSVHTSVLVSTGMQTYEKTRHRNSVLTL